VRRRSSYPPEFDDPLEPLAVYDDGIAFDPMPAVPDGRPTDARAVVRECVAVVAELVTESTEVRAQTPWRAITTAPVVSSSGRLLSTFTRMIGVQPAHLGDLPGWWRRCARDQRVEVGSRLVLDEPRAQPSGAWRMRGYLRSPGRLRAIPVELLLWPHLGEWTKLTLEPQRHVHCGRRYFRSGHHVLDQLSYQLIAELD